MTVALTCLCRSSVINQCPADTELSELKLLQDQGWGTWLWVLCSPQVSSRGWRSHGSCRSEWRRPLLRALVTCGQQGGKGTGTQWRPHVNPESDCHSRRRAASTQGPVTMTLSGDSRPCAWAPGKYRRWNTRARYRNRGLGPDVIDESKSGRQWLRTLLLQRVKGCALVGRRVWERQAGAQHPTVDGPGGVSGAARSPGLAAGGHMAQCPCWQRGTLSPGPRAVPVSCWIPDKVLSIKARWA